MVVLGPVVTNMKAEHADLHVFEQLVQLNHGMSCGKTEGKAEEPFLQVLPLIHACCPASPVHKGELREDVSTCFYSKKPTVAFLDSLVTCSSIPGMMLNMCSAILKKLGAS